MSTRPHPATPGDPNLIHGSAVEFGDPTPNAVGRKAMVSHDGCVVHLERQSAPRLLWYGEDLLSVKMPAGTRVVYPKPTIPGVPDRSEAIRYAISNPEAMDPLVSMLKPGMRITIAIDDISLPLPPMRTPDVRESVLNIVVDLLASKGIEDIHIIVATSFHRRMTAAEIRRAVGGRIFQAFYPDRLYNHDGEEPGGIVELGQTEHGEKVRLNKRAAESDLLIYVNINLVSMDGGHKSVGVGLCDYATLQAHHNPQTIRECDSYFDHKRSALTRSCNRIGKIVNQHVKIFHIETALNNAMFDPRMAFFTRNEDHYSAVDRAAFRTVQFALRQMPRAPKRKLLAAFPAAYDTIAVHAGATDATHEKSLKYNYAQYCVPVDGQSDVAIFGVPFISPYSVNSILNPLLVQVLALGYLF
ncbi:MAG: lactate racemase domain-containing protein, partial [Bryobacteraceae bacterium]